MMMNAQRMRGDKAPSILDLCTRWLITLLPLENGGKSSDIFRIGSFVDPTAGLDTVVAKERIRPPRLRHRSLGVNSHFVDWIILAG
jgi:hypothetical protein